MVASDVAGDGRLRVMIIYPKLVDRDRVSTTYVAYVS